MAAVPLPRPAGPRSRKGRSGRISGLDGLRALAVVLVIAYHVAPTVVPGGFLGVDVFFVVSGFLITTLLVRELGSSGRLSLPAFWSRRARRLLPALGLVVVSSVIAARLADVDLLVGIRRQVVGAATFTTNWVEIAAGTDYFDERQPQLLKPLWSLAIEEQFYLLWPALLVVGVVVVRSWRRLTRVAAAGALASAVAMAVLSSRIEDPTRAYYGTDTHAFGLLLGAAAAFAWAGGTVLLRPAAARWAPTAATAGLGVLALTMRDDAALAYRGGLALASVLAMVAVAGCTTGASAYLRVLDARPLRWVGERSYGLYLWHWPVLLVTSSLVVAPELSGRWWAGVGITVLVTGALAAASYRWVETPIRRDGFRVTAARVASAVQGSSPRWVAATGAATAVVVALGLVVTAPSASRVELAIARGEQAIVDAATRAMVADADGAPGVDLAGTPGAAAAEPSPPAAIDPSDVHEPPSPPQAPSRAASSATARPVVGADVVGFGDSVLSAAAPALLADIPGIALDAKPIRKWVDAPGILAAAAEAGRLRPVVLLAFGTNGGFQFAGSEAALREVLETIGPDRRVILVNSSGISYWLPEANARLAAIAAEYPNAVVVDWYSEAVAHPELLHNDRTHPNMAGIQVYAALVADALDG